MESGCCRIDWLQHRLHSMSRRVDILHHRLQESGVDYYFSKSTPDSVWNPECRRVDLRQHRIASMNRG